MTAMHEPKRIQLRRTKGWRKPEGAVVVARPSRWGNPFRVHRGTVYGPDWTTARRTWGCLPRLGDLDEWAMYISSSSHAAAVDWAVDLYRRLLTVRHREEMCALQEWLAPLVGHDLACWCPLVDENGHRVPCHADVLLELANR